MCDICNQFICPSGCPNYTPPPTVYHCVCCDTNICEGDDYYEIDGEPWCKECIDECCQTAELPEPDYDEEWENKQKRKRIV